MKPKKIFFALTVATVLTLFSITAWGATGDTVPAHMYVVGQNQGPIQGSCQMEGREGSILVSSFSHNINIPTDPKTGKLGKRAHGPFKILKDFDKSTPKLYRALVTGENLITVEIKFYHIDPAGVEEHYFTITLENAMIVNISPHSPLDFFAQNIGVPRDLETVSFIYSKITWRWEPDGIEFEDTWQTPQ